MRPRSLHKLGTLDRSTPLSSACDPGFPGPNLANRPTEPLFTGLFGICQFDDLHGLCFRAIQTHKAIRCHGIPENTIEGHVENHQSEAALRRLTQSLGDGICQNLAASISRAEADQENQATNQFDPQGPHIMTTFVLNSLTTFPLPSTATWRQETVADPDLSRIPTNPFDTGQSVRPRLLASTAERPDPT